MSIQKELEKIGVEVNKLHHNLNPNTLADHSIEKNEAILADNGALCIKTGKFTGRSPKDRYIVCDQTTENTVDWNSINQQVSTSVYKALKNYLLQEMNDLDAIYVHDGIGGADDKYSIGVRVIAEKPWSAQFAYNMFRRLTDEQQENFKPDWNILCMPSCTVDPELFGIKDSNFVVVNFSEKIVIIGGTGYTGEIKKSVFSILNYILPFEKDVLSMHCSANIGKEGDTAIYFGLSGTGKTTLSTDPDRQLIGDDEHGWSSEGVFNIEGGCYAKTINLSAEKEPEIYQAIRKGAILENIGFKNGTNVPDFSNCTITQNTRVSYPLHHIENIKPDSRGGHPKNIFFLTCDAFGVLPPVSKLTKEQAMYHFISGYTAKVAGTETGITEPEATFSACFGAPFLPLHPGKYAEMLGNRMDEHKTNIWLINTGWTGGSYPEGNRISLKYTRAIIKAILNGDLNDVDFNTLPVFNLSYPSSCPGLPSEVLNPKQTWEEKEKYDQKAENLAELFINNFNTYADGVSQEILNAAPQIEAVLT